MICQYAAKSFLSKKNTELEVRNTLVLCQVHTHLTPLKTLEGGIISSILQIGTGFKIG